MYILYLLKRTKTVCTDHLRSSCPPGKRWVAWGRMISVRIFKKRVVSRMETRLKRNADGSLVPRNVWLCCFRLHFPLQKIKQNKQKQGKSIKNICLSALESFQGRQNLWFQVAKGEGNQERGIYHLGIVFHWQFADTKSKSSREETEKLDGTFGRLIKQYFQIEGIRQKGQSGGSTP